MSSRSFSPSIATSLLALACACGSGVPQQESPEAAPPPPPDAEQIVRPSDRPQQSGDEADSTDSGESDGSTTPPGDQAPPATDDNDTGTANTGDDEPSTPPVQPLITARSSSTDSLLYTLVWRDPSALGSNLSHDHVVRATSWAGTLQFRVGDESSCFVDIDVDSAALLNDEPAMRAEVGLDGTLSDDDRETVRSHMLGEGQLEADAFPTISFTSTACRGDLDGNGTLEVDGDLTIRDVTQPVIWTVSYQVESDGRMFAQGNLTVSQTDFGITPYTAFFGAVRVADDVDLAFDLVGSP